jgi:hypothetical protein
MKLVQEFTMQATLKPPLSIGKVPTGERTYFEVAGGEISGDRLNGRILGGGEWALMGTDGFIRADVRLQVETTDGAFLYFQYVGLLEVNEAVQSALANGTGTGIEDQYFYTNPRIETGDERYAWVNRTFFIGEGRIAPGLGVEYRVWRPA